jgi:hypothetical protein
MNGVISGTDDELQIMNRLLSPLQARLSAEAGAPGKSLIFVIGLPRSGSTLLTQILINGLEIGYVSNFIARFWQCPAVGAVLQRAVLGVNERGLDADSNYGQTEGPFGPHEFGFFWRRWFNYGASHYAESGVEAEMLRAEVGSLEKALGKPLLFKNLAACGLHARWLAEVFPTAIFVLMRRNPHDIAHSILEARIKREGGAQNWFSVKPQSYPEISKLPVEQQIARQILDVELHLAKQLKSIDRKRWCLIEYDDLVSNPAQIVRDVASMAGVRLAPAAPDATAGIRKAAARRGRNPELDAAISEIVEASREWRLLYAEPVPPGLTAKERL